MENRFGKYLKFKINENGKVELNRPALTKKMMNKSFELFMNLYDNHYGTIIKNDNLISIHTGGWSENEALISEFEQTAWWARYHKITQKGGHYYFDLEDNGDKEWRVVSI